MIKSVFFILIFIVGFSYGKDMGKYGSVYLIAEKDLLKEMEEKARAIDYERLRQKFKNFVLNFKPGDLPVLTKAKKSEVYYVDYIYTLEKDIKIPTKSGFKTLYRKGFKFRPIKYIRYKPVDLVVFNGKDESEIRFVKKYFLDRNLRVRLVLSDGNYREVGKKLKAPVYYAYGKYFSLFKLKHTISRISVDIKRGQFRITVYAVNENGDLKDRDIYSLDKNSNLVRKKKER